MHSPDELTAAGYHKYPPTILMSSTAKALYQRRIEDDAGSTLYFINVIEYATHEVPVLAKERYRFSIEAQMYRHASPDSPGSTMDLTIHHEPDMTPANVECFYSMAYTSLGCCPDPHN